MNRREALKAVSVLMGGTVLGANAFLAGCSVKPDERVNDLFLESDVALMDEIGETIIPTTDTPGAKAAGIGGFMAMMVLDCYKPEDQQVFKEGLKALKSSFDTKYGGDFNSASPEDRLAFLNELDQEQVKYASERKENQPQHHYFRMMKELTLLGYYTSEVGCTQALRYIETPGRYDGCMDYKKGDKAWAT